MSDKVDNGMRDVFHIVLIFAMLWGDPDLFDLVMMALEKYIGS